MNGDTMINCRDMVSKNVLDDIDIERVSLFGAFNSAELDVLKRYLTVREYEAGQRIFAQGDLPAEIYIVVSGSVEFYVQSGDVTSLHGTYKCGQTFGESAFLGIQPQIGTSCVRGSAPACIVVLTRDALLALQEQEQALFAMLMMNLAREVSRKYQSALIEA